MIRYKCPRCKGNQYSASPDKAHEPCIYCGHEGTVPMRSLEEEGNDENIHEQDRPGAPCDDPDHMGLFKHMAGADQLPHQRGEEESQDRRELDHRWEQVTKKIDRLLEIGCGKKIDINEHSERSDNLYDEK